MSDLQQSSNAYPSPLSRELMLLRKLTDHYCGVYFVRTLEGFVHNLNGPLQILWIRSEQVQQDIGNLQEMLQGAGDAKAVALSDRMKERIDSFVKGLDDLNESLSFLTKDILAKRRSEIGQVRINEVVQDTLTLLKADMFFKHRVQKSLRLTDSLPSVRGRYSDLCVIMLNLIRNALEAMVNSEEKGLTVETTKHEDGVIINVRDTGCGISEEDGPRIFEPFFTTKRQIDYEGKVEKHMGLGLTLVSLFLEDCQGNIAFESLPDQTTFTVHLPCHP